MAAHSNILAASLNKASRKGVVVIIVTNVRYDGMTKVRTIQELVLPSPEKTVLTDKSRELMKNQQRCESFVKSRSIRPEA